MIRRTLKSLKPLTFALLVLVLTPCVVEFVFRVSMCRSQLRTTPGKSQLAVASSWYMHHELEPLQRTSVPVSGVSSSGSDQPSIELRTNSLGLRGPEIRIPKPVDTLRIVCLGDEAVLAAAIDEPQTFCQLVQARLQARSARRIEVINAGVPDFCPLLSYLQVRHRLLILNPDVIVAHLDMSDVWDDRRFRRLTELGAQEEPLLCADPGLSSAPMTQPFTQNFVSWQWAQNQMSTLLGQKGRLQTSTVDDPRSRYSWLTGDSSLWALQTELALSSFTHLANLCQEQGIRLLLAVHPAPWQLSATASRGARIPELNGIHPGTLIETTRAEELLAVFAQTRALPLCDVISLLRKQPAVDALFQSDSTEFSEIGHQYYAAALTASLVRSFPRLFTPSAQLSPAVRTDQYSQFPSRIPLDAVASQPMSLQRVEPTGFVHERQGTANRPASATSIPSERPSGTTMNGLVPISGTR